MRTDVTRSGTWTGRRVTVACLPLVFGLALAGGHTSAQQPPPQVGEATFRTGVELVALTVTAERVDGEFERGLAEKDFRILDEGVPQQIVMFGAGIAPVDLVLMLDTSGSMNSQLPLVKRAATNFLRILGPDDRAAIVTVGGRTSIPQGFTANGAALRSAIAGIRAEGKTALYDGLYIGLKTFKAPDPLAIRRRAIVLLSDGDDTASLLSYDSMLALAREIGVAIYPISIDRRSAADGARQVSPIDYELRTLARETGARAFFPDALADLEGVYESIARELMYQYSLAYAPNPPGVPGQFRRVTVIVGRTNLLARTRSGYVVSGG